ncbi:hypothetical protein [Nocardia arthritidis]|nr:hypothetical protein [Nocardia arthritidis]
MRDHDNQQVADDFGVPFGVARSGMHYALLPLRKLTERADGRVSRML